MRLLRLLESTSPVLDEDTVDRLLAGRLDTADAPLEYAGVARLLAAATAPPDPDELAGEAEAVARFAAAARSHPPTRRRAAVSSKRFSRKAAAIAIAAALSVGGVAAAASVILPGLAHRPAGQTDARTPGTSAAHAQGDATVAVATTLAAGPARTGSSATGGQGKATGPDAAGPARDGLCRAWLAGQGGQHGKRDDSAAFQALARAAGGAGKIAAYCRGTAPGSPGADGQGHGAPPSSDQGRGHGGSLTDPGQGQGGPPAGGPPTTVR